MQAIDVNASDKRTNSQRYPTLMIYLIIFDVLRRLGYVHYFSSLILLMILMFLTIFLKEFNV